MEKIEATLRALDMAQTPAEPQGNQVFMRAYVPNIGYAGKSGVPVGRCRKFLEQAVPLHTLAWLAIDRDPQIPFNSTHEALLSTIMKNSANANVVLADPLLRLQHFNNVMPFQFSDKTRAAESLLELWSRGLDLYYPEHESNLEV